ncbi:MAG: hypothetical protein BGO09_09645 [Bacteroidetes bacterium 47-18]|nr:MAG: hypothetical protein BGO09_09645 [Bacteroidetes bacterium 47-18]
MKRNVYYLLILLSALCLSQASCSRHLQSQFNIDVTLKDLPNTTIHLEELGINRVTLIATATTDRDGHAVLNGVFNTPQLYRLSIKNRGQIFLIIDQEDIHIDANPGNTRDYRVSGSPRSIQLRHFLQNVYELNKAMVAEEFSSPGYALLPEDSLSAATATRFSQRQKLYTFIKANADTTTLLPLALFYANFLPLDEEASYLRQFTTGLSQRFASEPDIVSNFQASFFNTYNGYVNDNKIGQDTSAASHLVGQPFKDFALKDIEGISVNTATYTGQYIVIQFLGSWNAKSRTANKELQQVRAQLPGYPVQLLSVYIEDNDKDFSKALTEDNILWPQVSSLQGWNCSIARQFRVNTVPRTVIISPEHRIIGFDWQPARIISEVKSSSQPPVRSSDSLSRTTVSAR